LYTSQDLVIVVPTKDRPREVRALLTSFSTQSERPGGLVLVDGGSSIEAIAKEFSDRLNIQYLTCHPPGQITQRLKGISAVSERVKLVGFFDDDIVLDEDAVEQMIEFWNRAPDETAGVAFNLTNFTPHRYSRLKAIFGMSGPPGAVLKSAYNVSVVSLSTNGRTSWLPGGCTVWKQTIVREFPQSELKMKWAAGEDVRFSYPIGKRYPLFVCADARVVDTGQALPDPSRVRIQSRKSCLAYYYLAERYAELSKLRCIWMIAASTIIFILKSVSLGPRSLSRAMGQIDALFDILVATVKGTSIKAALED
jgi:glycosyltransferase involved in cell wall biosynthesis